jgi:2-succinyl-6-hydroxy-2,4-cyclohexadiene-1-carboxylate synthase
VLVRLLLLHGFTATGRSWDPVRRALPARYDVVAPDLRPEPFAGTVAALRQDAPYALCGYSMGGRIALHLALAQPELVRALVLVSTTAGLEDPGERAVRRAADEALAASVERDGVEAFAERWAAGPLFASQPPEVAAAAHADRLRWSAADLAASLRLQGTGTMEPVWDRLGELTMPGVVVAGEHDAKFRALGERLASALPAATLTVVPGAGHAVHLEAPEAVAAAITAATRSCS